jgi:ketosteroid isomerase-like protein
MQMM